MQCGFIQSANLCTIDALLCVIERCNVICKMLHCMLFTAFDRIQKFLQKENFSEILQFQYETLYYGMSDGDSGKTRKALCS